MLRSKSSMSRLIRKTQNPRVALAFFSNLNRPTAFHWPKRILLLRHGESVGNVDDTAYARIPDWKIGLTPHGMEQARQAGKQVRDLCRGEVVMTYVSPYHRTLQTWEAIKEELQQPQGDVHILGARQEPRIAEQQFGNFQNPEKVWDAKRQRHRFGRFFYRFPNGEAGLDVYNRATSFWATLGRDLEQLRSHGNVDMEHANVVIVTHGLTLRLILMRYFQLTVEEFERSHNAPNAKLILMHRQVATNPDSSSRREFFRLDPESCQVLNLDGDISNERPVFSNDRSPLI